MEIQAPFQNIKDTINIECEHFDENYEHFLMAFLCSLLVIQILIAIFLLVWTILSARSSLASFVSVLNKPCDEVLGAAQFTERTMHQCQSCHKLS